MMKQGLLIIILVTLLTGCANSKIDLSKGKSVISNDSSRNVTNQSLSKKSVANSDTAKDSLSQTNTKVVKDEGRQIIELIDNYELKLIEAINTNNFTLVEPYLLKDSPIYLDQKKLVNALYSKGIKEEHISHDYGYTYVISENSRDVEVIERIKIIYPNHKRVTKDFQWIYSVSLEKQKIKLNKIRRWKEFEKDIEMLEGSVKSDGYYIAETLDDFDIDLIDKLNNKSADDFNELLENTKVKENYLKLINELKQKGHNFSLINSEITDASNLEDDEINPYKAKKALIISYINKKSKKKQIIVTLNMALEEKRIGFRGLFGGYALITSIKNVEIK